MPRVAVMPCGLAENTLFLADDWLPHLAVPSSAFWSDQNSGRRSEMSMYSHRQILPASFAGIGGRPSHRNVPLSVDSALG